MRDQSASGPRRDANGYSELFPERQRLQDPAAPPMRRIVQPVVPDIQVERDAKLSQPRGHDLGRPRPLDDANNRRHDGQTSDVDELCQLDDIGGISSEQNDAVQLCVQLADNPQEPALLRGERRDHDGRAFADAQFLPHAPALALGQAVVALQQRHAQPTGIWALVSEHRKEADAPWHRVGGRGKLRGIEPANVGVICQACVEHQQVPHGNGHLSIPGRSEPETDPSSSMRTTLTWAARNRSMNVRC